MEDEKNIRGRQNLHEEDVMMHDAPVGDNHGAGYSANYVDTASIITMLQNMQVQQDERYVDECRSESHLRLKNRVIQSDATTFVHSRFQL